MKRALKLGLLMIISAIATILFSSFAMAEDYNYINPEEVAKILKNNDQNYAIIDIQLQDNFEKHHLKTAIPTYAFPANKPEMHEKLKEGLASVKDDQKIIVVCPRGGGGAKNSVNYYRSIGVSNDRLFILKKGQEGWPETLEDSLVTK